MGPTRRQRPRLVGLLRHGVDRPDGDRDGAAPPGLPARDVVLPLARVPRRRRRRAARGPPEHDRRAPCPAARRRRRPAGPAAGGADAAHLEPRWGRAALHVASAARRADRSARADGGVPGIVASVPRGRGRGSGFKLRRATSRRVSARHSVAPGVQAPLRAPRPRDVAAVSASAIVEGGDARVERPIGVFLDPSSGCMLARRPRCVSTNSRPRVVRRHGIPLLKRSGREKRGQKPSRSRASSGGPVVLKSQV